MIVLQATVAVVALLVGSFFNLTQLGTHTYGMAVMVAISLLMEASIIGLS